ncbi:hypothetical protein [Oceanobacillus neutriphilus]|uniref:Uncharacterized protein n=1 Tax=Oceanobacillus neutriphilus TaxID=531815 RepID=A0ABQ2NR21_9BACI|nr:hypothetical protein [Oceanobacillus neutriphilus]GGP09130.1 hypothetical protein GCM10011346_11950 [Oceanobacillus neutriphilus]
MMVCKKTSQESIFEPNNRPFFSSGQTKPVYAVINRHDLGGNLELMYKKLFPAKMEKEFHYLTIKKICARRSMKDVFDLLIKNRKT